MIADIRQFLVPSIIAVSFFVFGFFVTADMLNLALREIAIGLVCGMIGGVTTLIVALHQDRAGERLQSSAP